MQAVHISLFFQPDPRLYNFRVNDTFDQYESGRWKPSLSILDSG